MAQQVLAARLDDLNLNNRTDVEEKGQKQFTHVVF